MSANENADDSKTWKDLKMIENLDDSGGFWERKHNRGVIKHHGPFEVAPIQIRYSICGDPDSIS